MTTCCRESAASCTWPSPATWSTTATADDERELERTTAVASHYAAAGDQTAALRSTVRAARAAECVLAYGEAADLAERALELWPRVPDADRPTELDHVDLLGRAARAHSRRRRPQPRRVLLQSALKELDPDQEPARYAALLARLARTIWQLNRSQEAVATGERALAMLPADDPLGVRPPLLAWLARTKFLRGRFRQATAEGEIALQAAVDAGDRSAESEVVNTLGMAHVALGEVEAGVAQLRRAIELARGDDELRQSRHRLLQPRRHAAVSPGAPRTVWRPPGRGLALTPRRLIRSHDWMTMTVSELAFEAGDWKLAREHLTPPAARLSGVGLIFRLVREAELALGVGDEDAARRRPGRRRAADRGHRAEPQFIGLYGSSARRAVRPPP